MAAATTTGDECRSAEESTSAQVAFLKPQLEVAGRADASAPVDRFKSRKAKAAVDRQALDLLWATSYRPPPRIPDYPFRYEPLQFDFAFMTVPVRLLAKHHQRAFLAADAKAVSSAGHSLLAHMENVPTDTLEIILSSRSTSFMMSMSNAVCTLLFALRTAYFNAITTPKSLDDTSTQDPREGLACAPPQSVALVASTSRTVATPAAALHPRVELRHRDRSGAE